MLKNQEYLPIPQAKFRNSYPLTGSQNRLWILSQLEGGSLAYLKSLWYYPHIGYGFIQVTHLTNYKKVQRAYKLIKGIDIDIVGNPKTLLDVKLSAFALVYGMRVGLFTGKKLNDYIGVKFDFRNARKIVNGMDKASEIATHASNFLRCL